MIRFWGKAQPLDPGRDPGWHPLAYHSLDVAAVGEALLTSQRRLGDSFSTLLVVPQEEVVPLLRYLLCLHDIGKFATSPVGTSNRCACPPREATPRPHRN